MAATPIQAEDELRLQKEELRSLQEFTDSERKASATAQHRATLADRMLAEAQRNLVTKSVAIVFGVTYGKDFYFQFVTGSPVVPGVFHCFPLALMDEYDMSRYKHGRRSDYFVKVTECKFTKVGKRAAYEPDNWYSLSYILQHAKKVNEPCVKVNKQRGDKDGCND